MTKAKSKRLCRNRTGRHLRNALEIPEIDGVSHLGLLRNIRFVLIVA